jgi:hypothetical protein
MQHSREIEGSAPLPSVFHCSITTLFELKMLNGIESDGRAIIIAVNIPENIFSNTLISSYIGVKLDTSLSRIEGT